MAQGKLAGPRIGLVSMIGDEISHLFEGGAFNDGGQFRAVQALRQFGQRAVVHRPGDGQAAGVRPQDFFAFQGIWNFQFHHHPQPPRIEQGGVHQVHPVGGAHHHHFTQQVEGVQLSNELAHQPFASSRFPLGVAPGENGVQFIEKQDAGRGLLGLQEDLPQGLFRFPDPFGKQRRGVHGDEVETAFGGHCPNQQRFPRSGGAAQQHPGWPLVSGGPVEVGKLVGQFHRRTQLVLGPVEAAHVLPADIGPFGEKLTGGGGFDAFEGVKEMAHGDLGFGDHFLHFPLGEIVALHQLPQGVHAGLLAQHLQVRSHEAMGHLGQPFQFHVVGQGHAPGMDEQDLQPARTVGDAHGHLAVEAPRAAQGVVQQLGHVGGADHHHLAPGDHAVHQGQQLGHHPFFHLAGHLGSLGGHRVDLVDEDDAGGIALGFLEQLAQLGLRFAIELMDDLRPVDEGEVGLDFRSHGTGDGGLAGAGRTVEQHALGRLDAQPGEQPWVFHRQFDHFPDAPQLRIEAADVLVLDRIGRLGRRASLFLNAHVGVGTGHATRALGIEGGHFELRAAAGKQRNGDLVPLHHHPAVQAGPDAGHVLRPEDHPLQRGQQQGGRGRHLLQGDADMLVQADPRVLPGQPVHLQRRAVVVLGPQGPDAGQGLALSFDQHRRARQRPHGHHHRLAHPHDAHFQVFQMRFRHAQAGADMGLGRG